MNRVLIVDDEAETARLLSDIVAFKGMDSKIAPTGAEALTLANDQPFDFILLDLMLPDISGYEVARRLKTNEQTRARPIVVVSAGLAVENLPRAFLHGVTEYLTKPFMPPWIFDAAIRCHAWTTAFSNRPNHGVVRLNAATRDFYSDVSWLRNLLLAYSPLDWNSGSRILEDLIRRRIRHEALLENSVDEPDWLANYHFDPDSLAIEIADRTASDRDAPNHDENWTRGREGTSWILTKRWQ